MDQAQPVAFEEWNTNTESVHAAVDIYCSNCKCIILKQWSTRAPQLDNDNNETPAEELQELPPTRVQQAVANNNTSTSSSPHEAPYPPFYWLVTNMMAFENVGFSRPVQSSDPPTSSSTTAGLRFLCCADCEMGPIGYNFTGKDRFYVAADRVRYKC